MTFPGTIARAPARLSVVAHSRQVTHWVGLSGTVQLVGWLHSTRPVHGRRSDVRYQPRQTLGPPLQSVAGAGRLAKLETGVHLNYWTTTRRVIRPDDCAIPGTPSLLAENDLRTLAIGDAGGMKAR